MARIRTIKPEFWTSSDVVRCSRDARLLFIGLWSFCDDAGRHPADAVRLKMEVFPADVIDVAPLLDELTAAGLIVQYEAKGKPYWQVTGWRHQRLDRPSFKHPGPDGFVDDSESVRGTLDESSTAEGRGVESSGVESSRKETANAVLAATASDGGTTTEAAILVFPCDGDRKSWNLFPSQRDRFKELYPSLDIMAEMRAALAWVEADATRRKTFNDMKKYLTNWLTRSQNDGRRKPAGFNQQRAPLGSRK